MHDAITLQLEPRDALLIGCCSWVPAAHRDLVHLIGDAQRRLHRQQRYAPLQDVGRPIDLAGRAESDEDASLGTFG